MSCSHKTSCGMFPVISLSSALKIWQTFYCDGKYETCERYRRSVAGEPVPRTLLPNGKMLDVVAGAEPTTACGQASPPGKSAEPPAASAAPINTAAPTRSSYYLRFRSKDGQRALQRAAATLQDLAVGVDAGLRKPFGTDGLQTCIVITDYAPEMDIYRAIVRIEDFDDVVGTVSSVRLDSMPAA